MRKLLFVTGMFDMILAVLLALGGVVYLKNVSGLDLTSSIADCIATLPVVDLVLLGVVCVLSILIFVHGITNIAAAIDPIKITKKDRILMNVSNLIATLGAGAFIGYVGVLSITTAITDLSIKMALYFGISIIVLIVMLVLVIVSFAKLPRGVKQPKIKKQKIKKVKTIKTKPAKIKIEKKQVLKAEEPKKDEVKENVVQPNFNFRKRK